jgi:putative ABC transport system substrate-binding protein
VSPDFTTTVHRELIIALAARHQFPTIYPFRYFVADGGLVSYGINLSEVYRQAASYIDRILRGEKPGRRYTPKRIGRPCASCRTPS